MVWENWGQVKEFPFTLKWHALILASLIFSFSYFIQIWVWYVITLKLGIALPFAETLTSWLYSQLGKYLPGKVWLLLGRFYFYESKGKSRREISIALYFEIATTLLGAGLLLGVSLLFIREIQLDFLKGSFVWIGLFLILGLFSLHPRILEKGFNWILFRFEKEPMIFPMAYPDVLWILFLCILTWAVEGIGFSLFVNAVFPVAGHQILFLTGALACSTMAGLLAIFAPSGLGVREGTLVYLLSLMMPGAAAVIISILTRLWMTLIEIGLIGVIYLFNKVHKGLERKDQHASPEKFTQKR